jgi:hypothetical protein
MQTGVRGGVRGIYMLQNESLVGGVRGGVRGIYIWARDNKDRDSSEFPTKLPRHVAIYIYNSLYIYITI